MAKPSKPYHLDVQFRGHVEGLTYVDDESRPLCHFFGGIPYALPPVGPFRFEKPRSLPPCYRYGTKVNPARFVGGCGLCPQPNFTEELDDEAWDEDCLQTNVWIPIGAPPAADGGFLQYGSPNLLDARSFLSSSPIKCIIVAPSYRVNILGFLSSSTLPSSNLGFWDQRLALQWTYENISYFSGNASNITIAGYSAGSHSVFHQLAYDIGQKDSKSIVKRAIMWSNGSGLQPKPMSEADEQYAQLLTALDISTSLAPKEQLARLRSLPTKALLKALFKIPLHQFRATTDGSFVREGLLQELSSGTFAAIMKRRNIHLLIGECADEHFLYSAWRTPKPGYHALKKRLEADYPQHSVPIILAHYFPHASRALPAGFKDWKDLFGRIYADVQIHFLARGNIYALSTSGAGDNVHRYRIEWRAKCVDKKIPVEHGVTHTSDLPIWFWGNGDELLGTEQDIVRTAFLNPLGRFLDGDVESMGWDAKGAMQVRTLKSDGRVVIEDDGVRMKEALSVWEKLKKGGFTGDAKEKAKL